ncbi:hypothetical protein F5884DRAFT_175241 [Xylogone sp. PMI_703]|nr:hypothetical protein F5884DRAFT_175241 [Xylogone sp. PMI_703]
MANAGLGPGRALPRFLLPRLSWQTAPIHQHAIRALSTFPHAHSKSDSDRTSIIYPSIIGHNIRSRSDSLQWHNPTQSRNFHATRRQARDHHFDTLKFVQKLKEEGFTEAQAVAMMKVLNDVIEESIQNLTRTMVLREDANRATYAQKVDFAKLRSELLSADSTENSTTRASHDRLTNDIAKLNSRLRDEISRTQASVRLDLNLEKGRIREEAKATELEILKTESRIETEVAALREKLEGVKFQTLQWLMGVCTGTAALILGAWRLLM